MVSAQDRFENINILLNHAASDNVSWWEITVKDNARDYIVFLTFNDRVAPAGFSLITGYG